MTLTSRLLLFYVSSLVVLLAAFSAAIYLVARDRLYGQADERVEAALNTLGAAVEIAPDGVEWEPDGRTIRFVPGPGRDHLAWFISDDAGRLVARSDLPDCDDLLVRAAQQFDAPQVGSQLLHWRGGYWRVGRRWFFPGETPPIPSPSVPGPNKEVKYPSLVITCALSLEPTQDALHSLLMALTTASFGVVAVALIAGRIVCRRALRPVVRMAEDARAIDPSQPAHRIGVPLGGDELTDLATAFNGLLDRLNASAEQHRRFAGDASHQLRTPLAALLGQIEIALRKDRTPDQYKDSLVKAQSKGMHIQQIVESLLFLTRADSEARERRHERIDLASWTAIYLERFANHERFGDISLVGADRSLFIVSHPVLLGEVVSVLLDNACRYSSCGSPIEIVLSEEAGWTRLEIADKGCGIAPADLAQVFTPFFRATQSLRANKNGIGLGLSIARRLAESLGGRLSVTSELNVGSRFAISIPTSMGAAPYGSLPSKTSSP